MKRTDLIKGLVENALDFAAARRRLPTVEVDGATPLIGERGAVTLLDAFEGRRMLIAYYFMWHTDRPAPDQCEGCTWVTSQVRELSYIHSRAPTLTLVVNAARNVATGRVLLGTYLGTDAAERDGKRYAATAVARMIAA